MTTGATSASFLGHTWTDLVAPANAINPTGPDLAATVSTVDGTLRFQEGTAGGGTQNQSVFISFQMPHSYLEGSDIQPHVHWYKTTSAAGSVRWQMKYVWANIGSAFTNLAAESWVTATSGVPSLDTIYTQALDYWTLSGAGKEISSVLLVAIRRDVEDASDTYEAPVALASVDVHYQQAQSGSIGTAPPLP